MVRGLLIFIVLAALNTYAQEWDWVKRINGYQNDSSLGVDVDDSGYVYVTGRSKYAVTFEDGINSIFHPGFAEQDVFVAKYDSLGNLICVNLTGGLGNQMFQFAAAKNLAIKYNNRTMGLNVE